MCSLVLPINDDEEMYPSVPPGYKFTPTDEALIESFLCKKICGIREPYDYKIKDLDVYNTSNLEEVIEKYEAYGEKCNEWFFFSPIKLKQEKGRRRERITPDGRQWKITHRNNIKRRDGLLIGEKRTFNYVKKGSRTAKFIMYEYTVCEPFFEKIKNGLGNLISETSSRTTTDDMTFDEWVVCKIHVNRCKKTSSSGKENNGRMPETSRKRKEPPLSVETHDNMEDQYSSLDSEHNHNSNHEDYMYQEFSARAQHDEQESRLTVDNVLGNHNSPNNTQELSISDYDYGIDQSMDLPNNNEQGNYTTQVLHEEYGDKPPSWFMGIIPPPGIFNEEENLVTPQMHPAVTADNNIDGNQTSCHYQLEVSAGGIHHHVPSLDISYLNEQVNLSIPQHEKYQFPGNDVFGDHYSCQNNQQELAADHDHPLYMDPGGPCYSPSLNDMMIRMNMGVDSGGDIEAQRWCMNV